jgi:GT2 family glycosyltransferase
MNSLSLSRAVLAKRDSELSQLIRHFTAARDAGDPMAALRSIDRAWRMAPDNPEINFLYGRLQLSLGASADAAVLLEKAAASRSHPDYEASYISALCSSGRLELAHHRLETALKVFAVAPGGALAEAARLVAGAWTLQFPGWVGIGPDLKFHGELVGQTGTIKLEIAGDSFPPRVHRVKCGTDGTVAPFVIPTDGMTPAHVTIRANDRILLGGKQDFPPDFGLDGRVTLAKGSISGWAALKWDPSWPLKLTAAGGDGFSTALATSPDPTQFVRQLFSLAREVYEDAGNAITVSAALPDGSSADLPASPFLLRPPRPPSKPALVWQATHKPAIAPERRGIDIVIPVYSGVDETLACIRSVIATTRNQAQIVVIDDASPDRDMASALVRLANTGAITVLHNERNLGFPKTANRGFAVHPDHDVVLLNADTEVYGDWLSRLRAAAYGEERIATVTPLTNSGSIATYPSSEVPDATSRFASELDQLAAETNAGMTIAIPTAVGFCMYIRRDCMNEVGYFDTETFLKGYGEENDLCQRATNGGWKHVLAADIYVRHSGNRSFGGRRAALLERNLRLLNLRHRHYDAAVRDYLEQEPAHPARRRLDEARLLRASGRHVLIVSLNAEGGVSRAVRERIAAMRSKGLYPVLLTPDLENDGRIDLTVDDAGFDDLYYDFANESDRLTAFLWRLKCEYVEIHHFLDLPTALIEQLFALSYPVDVAIHDYVWYCPRVTLLDGAGRYCGEPDVAVCQACIDKNGGRLRDGASVAELRSRSARWLRAARDISVPTDSVRRRMEAKFPGLRFRVEPLEDNIPAAVPPVPAAGQKQLKVALIGAIGAHKGHKTLLKMAAHAAKYDLPIEFVVIGFTENDRALSATGKVFITGLYKEAEVEGLIARESPDLILFLSVFPESWCYSLTYALRAGIPVAAFDFGALGDRLRGSAADPLLFPPSASPADICDRLLAAFQIPVQNHIATPLDRNRSSRLRNKSDILLNIIKTPDMAEISRTIMAPTTTAPTASVNFLPLTKGLFLFSVRSTQPSQRVDDQGGMSLPAMQVTAAPGAPEGQIEFMMAPQTRNGWLSEPNDQVVARVTEASAVVLLTSVMIPGMTPLEIEVQRLGQAEEPPALPVQEAAPAQRALPQLPTQKSIKLEITAHVQNHGDMTFGEAQWAGFAAQGLWIESFAIRPLEDISADMIEYKAVTSTGVETPWVSNGQSCGTRGIGVPLVGFSVRIKPQSGVQPMTCEYGAMLLSGAMLGPARNGVPVRSAAGNDPVTGIWLSISGPAGKVAESPSSETPKQKKPAKAAVSAQEAVTVVPSEKPAAPEAKKKAPIGPRFSVFREAATTDQE